MIVYVLFILPAYLMKLLNFSTLPDETDETEFLKFPDSFFLSFEKFVFFTIRQLVEKRIYCRL
jgi:hypothetical protein